MVSAQAINHTLDPHLHSDIVVVGGGVVGALLCQALLNTKLDLTITLVTNNSGTTGVYEDDIRALALSHQTLSQLAKMGVDTTFIKSQIEQIHISDRGNIGHTRLLASEQGVSALGYVAQISVLEQVLSDALKNALVTDRFTIIEGAECIDIQTVGDTNADLDSSIAPGIVKICALDNGQQVSAQAVILADGQVSRLKNNIGIESLVTDYGQHGVVTIVGVDRYGPARYQQPLTAFERFTEHGPLALLPVSLGTGVAPIGQRSSGPIKQYYSVVWCTHEQRAKALQALPEIDFLQALQTEFGDRAGRFAYVSTVQAFPLKLTRHDDSHSPVLCIGNAAQALHPIAGQGFNLAVRDIADFVSSVQALPASASLGSIAHLQEVRAMRKTDRKTIICATNALLYGFSNNHCLLSNARAKGLTALHLTKPLKTWFAKMAMGYR